MVPIIPSQERLLFWYTEYTDMTKRSRTLFFLAALLFLFLPRVSSAETIRSFRSAIEVKPSGDMEVRETVVYDFEGAQRHGIYRDIPYSYKRDSLNYRVILNVRSVVDEAGSAYPFTLARENGMLRIRIGDPDVLITGERVYEISYDVRRALNWFDQEAELYWNVTGNTWFVPIQAASATLSAPAPWTATRCFTGPVGSTDEVCSIGTDGTNVTVASRTVLLSGEGLTVVARVPATAVPQPTGIQRFFMMLRDNIGFGLPVLAFIVLLLLWRKYGRDPQGRGTIIPEYEPPQGMSPAMLGYLIDQRIDPRDITATMIQLAVKGYLTIRYVDKATLGLFGHTYELTLKKEADGALSPFEATLLGLLFQDGGTVKLNQLRSTLPRQLPELKAGLEHEAVKLGYFRHRPRFVQSIYFFIGAFAFGISFFLGAVIGVAFAVGIGLSGVLTVLFGIVMPARSELGARLTDDIRGFRQFLSVTETDRLKFHNAPDRKPEQFMAFLPFAIALAVEKEWAEQFKSITLEQPGWYAGEGWTTFNAVLLVSSLRDFGSTAKSQAFISPQAAAGGGVSGFGGGGFSGGGFGGGGGGSW